MKTPGILILLTILVCSSVVGQAQNPAPCNVNPDRFFSNQLPGFMFYGQGKLSGLTFESSKIDDVRNIFGTPIERSSQSEVYDYDSDWRIIFDYYTETQTFHSIRTDGNGAEVRKTFFIRPEYVGTIDAIRLQPKKNFSFDETSAPFKSRKLIKLKTNGADFYSGGRIRYQVLNYEIKTERFYNDSGEPVFRYSRGDIMEISYSNPCVKGINDPKMYDFEK